MATFIVWCPEYGSEFNDGEEMTASCPEYAAQEWAHTYDAEGDYTILKGSPAIVHVADPDGKSTKVFRVHGETVAEYTAYEVKL